MDEPLTGQPKSLELRGHIGGLDVLRGAAILMVLLCHAYYYATPPGHWHGLAAFWVGITGLGHMGVHLFFVLSGFLITGILLDSAGNAHAARRFYLRRARRILPAYLGVLAVIYAVHLVDWHFVLASLLFAANMGHLVRIRLTEFGSLWSLSVEEQFYLFWPWVLWRCTPRTVRRTMTVCLILPPLLRFALTAAGQDSYTKAWVNADYLMYGAVIAYTARSGALHSGNIGRIARWLYGLSLGGLALSSVIWLAARTRVWALLLFVAVGRTPWILLFAAMTLSCLIAHQSGAGIRAGSFWHLPRRGLIFLGYISYGLYLIHMIVFDLYDRYVADTRLGGYEHSFALLTLRAALCSTASILIAWLSRETLEAWFLRRNSARAHAIHAAPLPTALPVPPSE